MGKRIKYQGKVYIMESEVDDQIKANVLEKVENTINEVFEDGEGTESEDEATEYPIDENVEPSLDDTRINEALQSLEASLGIQIDETGKMLLSTTLADIIQNQEEPIDGAESIQETPALAEAPNNILHEGKIYRKVGKIKDSVKKTIKESTETGAPKSIRVGGKVFALAESQDLSKFTRK